MTKHTLSVLVLAWGTAMSAQAADWYVGGAVGQANWKIDNAPSGLDDSDTGYKLFAGASLSPNFAVEGGYASLGKASFGSDNIKGTAFFVDALGIMPLTPDWAVFGKIGLVSGKTKTTWAGGGNTNTDLHYGVGAQYNLSKTVAVRAEWERFRLKADGDKGDIDLLSIGVSFAF